MTCTIIWAQLSLVNADKMLYLVDVEAIFYLPSGKHTKNDGKSQFLMGKVTISMAIFISKVLVYQMVVPNTCCPRYFSFSAWYMAWWGAGLDEQPRLQVDFRASSAGVSVTLKWAPAEAFMGLHVGHVWACSKWRFSQNRGTPNHQNQITPVLKPLVWGSTI